MCGLHSKWLRRTDNLECRDHGLRAAACQMAWKGTHSYRIYEVATKVTQSFRSIGETGGARAGTASIENQRRTVEMVGNQDQGNRLRWNTNYYQEEARLRFCSGSVLDVRDLPSTTLALTLGLFHLWHLSGKRKPDSESNTTINQEMINPATLILDRSGSVRRELDLEGQKNLLGQTKRTHSGDAKPINSPFGSTQVEEISLGKHYAMVLERD
ncbi:hypothetical protein BU17DRAFT_67876 [Hysterangium stoloniferum]|nr:hypothetical protein BU17DRAFT_67876 [Hysterangium stoloniferum]